MQHGQIKCSGKKIWFLITWTRKVKMTIEFFFLKILFSLTLSSLPQLGISCLLQKDINGQWSEWVWPRRIHFWVLSFCVGGKTGQLKRKTDFPVKAFAISHVPESMCCLHGLLELLENFLSFWHNRILSAWMSTPEGEKRQHLCSENLQKCLGRQP